MNKKIIASVLAVAFAISMVGSARAVTLEELQALYNDLLAKYEVLLAQVGQPTTVTGICLSSDLKFGMTSAEVSALQQGLKQDQTVYPEGLTTGYFGPLTKAAVIRFQNKFAPEVLASWGFTKGTGYVGSTTIAKFNSLYCVPPISTTTTTKQSITTTTIAGYMPFCGQEGEKLNRNPFFGATNKVCCSGLTDIRESKSYSICVNCGDKVCKYPENSTNCPVDCEINVQALPECQWCGMACMRVYPWMECPDILPPQGYICTEINGKCTSAFQLPSTIESKCTELNTILTNAYNTKCGDAKYNKVADVNNSKKIDFDDLMIFATNAENETWCKEQLEKVFNPCNIPSNIGEQATKLLAIMTNAYNTKCGDAKYNKVADVNNSKKIDFDDLMIFATNAENETWCKEQLEKVFNPCDQTTTTTVPPTTTTKPPTTTTTTTTIPSTTTTTIGSKCTELNTILTNAYNTKCGDAKYNSVADFGGYLGDPQKDGKVDFEDLMIFATNAENEAWCQEQLESTINPCEISLEPINSINDA